MFNIEASNGRLAPRIDTHSHLRNVHFSLQRYEARIGVRNTDELMQELLGGSLTHSAKLIDSPLKSPETSEHFTPRTSHGQNISESGQTEWGKIIKWLLVAPNHELASFLTVLPMGKPASQPASHPAKLGIGSFYPCSAFLGFFMQGSLGLSGPLWVSLCEAVPLRGCLRFSGSFYTTGCSESDLEPKAGPLICHSSPVTSLVLNALLS